MNIRRTYRIVFLLISALVFSPLLSINGAYAMKHDSPAQHQKATSGLSTSCHQISEYNECSQCVTLNDNQCQHAVGDECASSCGHSVVTAAFIDQNFDAPLYHQDTQILSEQFSMSVILDPDLRPPQ